MSETSLDRYLNGTATPEERHFWFGRYRLPRPYPDHWQLFGSLLDSIDGVSPPSATARGQRSHYPGAPQEQSK